MFFTHPYLFASGPQPASPWRRGLAVPVGIWHRGSGDRLSTGAVERRLQGNRQTPPAPLGMGSIVRNGSRHPGGAW